LRKVQAAYAEFAEWLSDELGDRKAGQFWTDRALEWAHETDDELIVGYILARRRNGLLRLAMQPPPSAWLARPSDAER
jgi:hypothetical protein